MGSQRALETVRGVVDAVWLQDASCPDAAKPPRQVWTHPEYSGVDLDLSVMTTNSLAAHTPSGKRARSIDFHELYWAHLMSETRAVAVLLWLFELVRKGPRLKPDMRALWWGASIFLCMVIMSVVLLGLQIALQLLVHPPLVPNSQLQSEALLLAPVFVVFGIAAYAAITATLMSAFRIAVPATVVAGMTFWLFFRIGDETLHHWVAIFLPIAASTLVAVVAMGPWGAIVMVISYLGGGLIFGIYLHLRYMIEWGSCLLYLPAWLSPNSCVPLITSLAPLADIWHQGWIFWSLTEDQSMFIAFFVIIVYLAAYALFLQPYLGDAARYFRNAPGNVAVRREIRKQAVDTLDALHASGRYDRIIVVAHSLGTVVAYDMLRAYFSRICNCLPDPAALGPEVTSIDSMVIDPTVPGQKEALRHDAREIIRSIAAVQADGSGQAPAKWLVTDFVTLGSPLTHAHYLMCNGGTYEELTADFERRVGEREYPTCPPARDARNPTDGLLLFTNPISKSQEFHHGALFGLTRWTNLYFPLRQLFWGDAIGGPLAPLFGPHIRDVEVSTYQPRRDAFFTHTAYWSLKWPEKRAAPHIVALMDAINLEDE